MMTKTILTRKRPVLRKPERVKKVMRKSIPLRRKIILGMQEKLMKKSILPRKKKVMRTLERVAVRPRKKWFQIFMTLLAPRHSEEEVKLSREKNKS